ncbi:MAG: riboflavin synthase [Gammaproteobacteria bacterium]|jgi:riboflavin synthase|nr:riboflavin synthase [Gammaproteobacteria bacterium]MBL6818945.1 riboflavin synthase [Gammaproteobacteria bacterium]MBL6898928.1 riboflavin synthase [Gammaproteobacteria bacterium]
MFTGIIETIGKVSSVKNNGKSSFVNIIIKNTNYSLGDSICVNGVCLTIDNIENDKYSFTVSPETNQRTNLKYLSNDQEVNIETSLTINKLISGHLVQGHVDGTVKIIKIQEMDTSWYIRFEIETGLSKYIIKKGSVTLDGVSLTVNDVSNLEFSVMIIPHTYQNTIFKSYVVGNEINIELDMLAKYIEKLGNYND